VLCLRAAKKIRPSRNADDAPSRRSYTHPIGAQNIPQTPAIQRFRSPTLRHSNIFQSETQKAPPFKHFDSQFFLRTPAHFGKKPPGSFLAMDIQPSLIILSRMNALLQSILVLCLAAFALMNGMAAEPKDSKVYELRIYYAPEGKLDALHARFRDHTVKLFEKHGIQNIGYWVPVGENKENKLAYIIAHPSREKAKENWAAFFKDPDWQKAARESEANGKIVAKVESYFMQLTDYSPVPEPDIASAGRVFEFRTYTTPANGLDAINARFRDHTRKLFEKHGMKNLAYFNRMKDQKDADVTLFYILAHKSEDAAKESFTAFRNDPDWIAARKASEEKAGGSLTIKDGVKSEFYKATDYSPIR
jgi:hypothetical protein